MARLLKADKNNDSSQPSYEEEHHWAHNRQKNRKLRLHDNWTVKDWRNVAWSSEGLISTAAFGSEFCINNLKGRVHPTMFKCLGWWWCNGVEQIFLAHFRPLNTNWAYTVSIQRLPEYFFMILWLQYTCFLLAIQQDRVSCHKAQIILSWFLENENELNVLKRPPHLLYLNPVEDLW